MNEKKKEGKDFDSSLCFNKISIRKQLHHSKMCHHSKMMLGIVTTDNRSDLDNELVKQVIVFMLSGSNVRFKIPVAYHFVSSLNGGKRNVLLQEVNGELKDINVRVSTVAFDGHPANAPIVALLGANSNVNFEIEPNQSDEAE